MLRVLGTANRLCDGVTRREMLRAGGLGLFGLSLADLFHLQSMARGDQAPNGATASGFGKAKSCILLYLYGAPSQLEMFDLKPDAPMDVRGQFKPISTSVPGVQICEYLPLTAKAMHFGTLVRSMSHPYNIHSAAYTLTGAPTTDIPMELNPRDTRHWPFFGSVLDYLQSRTAQAPRDFPLSVALPWRFSSRSEPYRRGGPFGGFLGSGYDPVWAEYADDMPSDDPYRKITPQARFQLLPPGAPEITLDGLSRRQTLLQQLDKLQGRIDHSASALGFNRHQDMAFSLMTSPKVKQALEVNREPESVRERYGMTLFGQSVLAARRLIEHGAKLTTVIWDEYQEANSAWDTHIHQWARLKDSLLPGFDRAYSALLEDLEARGMLDETLVVCVSEHGRTPKLNKEPSGGREHWSEVYSGLFAGGGIRRGSLYGASDRIAGYPKDHPVSPKDVLATIYHLLGVDPKTELRDREGRPLPLVAEGKILEGIVA